MTASKEVEKAALEAGALALEAKANQRLRFLRFCGWMMGGEHRVRKFAAAQVLLGYVGKLRRAAARIERSSNEPMREM